MHSPFPRSDRKFGRGYTLIEILVVVTVLAIAGALIVPAFGGTDVLRVQGAIRSVVADLAEAQSDAIAFQRGRAVVFFPDDSRYVVAEVNSPNLDLTLDSLQERALNLSIFGFTRIDAVTFPNNTLVFDELGGPVTAPQSGVAAPEGWIDLTGSDQTFRLRVEAYTGRITVERVQAEAPPPEPEPEP